MTNDASPNDNFFFKFQELYDSRDKLQLLENEIKALTFSNECLSEDKKQLESEVGKQKSHPFDAQKATSSPLQGKTASEVALMPVGNLRVYEVMLGLCFVSIILNWIFL